MLYLLHTLWRMSGILNLVEEECCVRSFHAKNYIIELELAHPVSIEFSSNVTTPIVDVCTAAT